MTGYQREAFVGRDADLGLRVTLDHRIRGRDRDFQLGAEAENRLIVPAAAGGGRGQGQRAGPVLVHRPRRPRASSPVVRISKYCQSVEAFGRAPRSVFHVQDDDPAAAWRTAAPHEK